MTLTLFPAAERIASPWKNGGGVTREVAVHPESAGGLADFDWRVSLADIGEAGPFSAFDGYDRVITLVRGSGMVLTIDGVEHRVAAPYAPLAFSGDSSTGCELIDGPIVDFNVMTRRGAVRATVEFVEVAASGGFVSVATSGADEAVMVVLFDGAAAVVSGAGRTALGRLDAVVLRDETDAVLHGPSATVAVVRITDLIAALR